MRSAAGFSVAGCGAFTIHGDAQPWHPYRPSVSRVLHLWQRVLTDMNIAYFFGFDVFPGWPLSASEHPAYVLASHRLRSVIPASQLLAAGHIVSVVSSPKDWELNSLDEKRVPDRLILTKLSHPSTEVFEGLMAAAFSQVEAARRHGAKILMDYSDDLLGSDDHRSFRTLQLLRQVDRIVCASSELAKRVRLCLDDSADVLVIPDPVEGERVEPLVRLSPPTQVLRVLWFGHVSNLDSLLGALKTIAAKGLSILIELEILTSVNPEQLFHFQLMLLGFSLPFPVRFSEWRGPMSLTEALQRSDVSFLPIDLAGPKAAASNNRLVHSFWGGCYVVASPIQSYLDFVDLAWLDDDLTAGLVWVSEHPRTAAAKVLNAQERIARHFSPEAIGEAWQAALVR